MFEENIKTILKEHQEDMKRYVSALKEDSDQKFEVIVRQHKSIITKLDSHTKMMEKMGRLLEATLNSSKILLKEK